MAKNENAIAWAETEPGRVWRSVDGRYAIVAHVLPEHPPRTIYQARKIDQEMAKAYPQRQDLGYLIEESPWCWNTENSLHSAQAIVEQDAFQSAHDRDVPNDHPAIALTRFFWPISRGATRAALAVVSNGGRLIAQVLGMARDGEGFTPAAWAEIDLTELDLITRDGTPPENTTDHGPDPCSCGAKVSQPHTDECARATCLVTGQQRLLCSYFGGSPLAGVEAVSTGSQEEFEQYFKTPTGHDCGQDVWTGRR